MRPPPVSATAYTYLADVDGIVGEGLVEDLQLVEELREPEPESVVAKLDGKVDHDHDHCHPKMLDCRSMCNFVQNSRVRYIPYMVVSITFKYKYKNLQVTVSFKVQRSLSRRRAAKIPQCNLILAIT